MRILRFAALAVAAVLSIAAHPNWTITVARGENGSHILGNPEAKVRLTEFVSYTCPHCAHFNRESDAALKLAYVMPGKVSVEVRHVVRDPIDLAVALMANCGDPGRFFGNHNMFLQTQENWIGVIGQASTLQQSRWTTGPLAGRMRAIAADFGFYPMMEQRGYRRSDVDRCLGDEAAARQLAAQTRAAADAGVEGTPSFMIDDALLADTHDWKSLDAQLRARF